MMLLDSSEDDAKLRRVFTVGGENLPAARFEIVGDRAVSSESDSVSCSRNGAELENRRAIGTRNFYGSVHPRSRRLDNLRLRRLGLRRLRASGEPR